MIVKLSIGGDHHRVDISELGFIIKAGIERIDDYISEEEDCADLRRTRQSAEQIETFLFPPSPDDDIPY